MALFYECMLQCARKGLDTADIVREAILQQLSVRGYTALNELQMESAANLRFCGSSFR